MVLDWDVIGASSYSVGSQMASISSVKFPRLQPPFFCKMVMLLTLVITVEEIMQVKTLKIINHCEDDTCFI